MPGPNDLWPWLQSIMQNQGAGTPNSVAGMPRYGAGPGNLGMGDPQGLTANTPGPSMGYPALGAQPQQPPPPAPDARGFSVGVHPHGDGPPDVMSPAAMAGAQPAAQPQPQPAPPFVQPQHPSTMRYPMWPTPPAADAPAGSPSATPKPAGPLATSGGGGATMKRTPGAPNLGYYQGNNNRFIGIAQPNASPQNSMRAGPQATALNLAGLFGGRGQPAAAAAVNPNVPAANAQPVSSASPPAAPGNAPMPPIMPGDIRNQRVANAVRNPNWWQNL